MSGERDTSFLEGARHLGWTDARSIVSLLYAIDQVRKEVGGDENNALLFGLKMALGVMFDFEGETTCLEDQLWALAEDVVDQ